MANGMTPIDAMLGNSPTAPYPAQNFPATSFFGPNVAPRTASPASVDKKPGDMTQERHIVLWLVVIIAVGYFVWHKNYNR